MSGDSDAITKWYTAGLLSAINRHVRDESSNEYFDNIIKTALESNEEKLPELLELINAGYRKASDSEKRKMTGRFSNLDVKATPDFIDRIKAVNESIKTTPKNNRDVIVTSTKNAFLSKNGHLIPKYRINPSKIKIPSIDESLDDVPIPEPLKLPEDDIDFPLEDIDFPLESENNCKLRVTFEGIKVINDTWGWGDDDVFVKIESDGMVWTNGEKRRHIPMDGQDESEWQIGTGGKRFPKTMIAEVKPFADDIVYLQTLSLFFEADFDKIDKLLRKAMSKLAGSIAAAAAAAAGGGPVMAPLAGMGASKLVNGLLKLLGLGDDFMGEVNYQIHDKINSGTIIEYMNMVPSFFNPPKGYRYQSFDGRKIRLIRDMHAHSGHWRAAFMIEIICE